METILKRTILTARQRRALCLMDEAGVNAVWIARRPGYAWKEDVRRDPWYADRVLARFGEGSRTRRAARLRAMGSFGR